jgi:hypothetical protein
MKSWNKAMLIGVAVLSATATAYAHMGGVGGRSPGGVHGFHGFHSRSFPFGFHRYNFGVGFSNGRAAGWGGGAYSGDVAGFGYDGDDDFAPEDLHFRVQESFGPGDIGRQAAPDETYDYGPGEAARMDPWHGYEPDGW